MRTSFYKKQRNKCVNLHKKAIKMYFNNITKSGIIENKKILANN